VGMTPNDYRKNFARTKTEILPVFNML